MLESEQENDNLPGDRMRRLGARQGKPDANQAEIVKDLRARHYSVSITSGMGHGFPDLVIGHLCASGPRNTMLEVKPEGKSQTQAEIDFQGDWKGQYDIVHSTEEALRVIYREEAK